MNDRTVTWEQSEAVGWLTLNRPETLNAWTAQLGSELRDLLDGEAADLGARGRAIGRRGHRPRGELAAGPTRSYASSQRALNSALYRDLEAQLELEAELQHALGRTDDFLEGAAAFVQRRAPRFGGI